MAFHRRHRAGHILIKAYMPRLALPDDLSTLTRPSTHGPGVLSSLIRRNEDHSRPAKSLREMGERPCERRKCAQSRVPIRDDSAAGRRSALLATEKSRRQMRRRERYGADEAESSS